LLVEDVPSSSQWGASQRPAIALRGTAVPVQSWETTQQPVSASGVAAPQTPAQRAEGGTANPWVETNRVHIASPPNDTWPDASPGESLRTEEE
jgi:hypothetical protein